MNTHKIYINHIPISYDVSQIEQLFAACGTITEVIYPVDKKTKKHKGYAFVTFEEPGATQSALAKNNEELEGQTLIVEIAKEKLKKNTVWDTTKLKAKGKDKGKSKTKDKNHHDQ